MNIDDIPGAGPRRARVEIIPLIDVVFFLLATFVLFTLSLNKIVSIATALPKGGPPVIEDHTVYLQAVDGGMYYWKQGSEGIAELIPARELPARLLNYRRQTAEPRVFVRGDGKAKFGDAVLALDEVRKAGIVQVSVETKVSQTGR
ncbi:MAG TPA: biopolymer transporter ExbD [Opitutus sp.]|nr:biopolymer transporter ExbD [Opitutus sp.]